MLVNARSTSGALEVGGVQGAVQASRLGAITLSDIGGDLTARSNSGRISGTQLPRPQRAVEQRLGQPDGEFVDPAQVETRAAASS